MRIFITGATGVIGRRVVHDRLERGDEVVALTRDAQRGGRRLSAAGGQAPEIVEGDPTVAGSWQERLSGCDAVVHLAGAGVGDRRWSEAYKKVLADSRIESTRRVVEAIGAASPRPAVLVSGSAVGWYGDCGDRIVDETSPPGDDFLAQLCERWETEAEVAEAHGARVVCLRTGLVLDDGGGVLPRMARIFSLFAGGPLGPGDQFMPWIHWRDEVGIVDLALRDESVDGPLNAVGPHPVSSREFARTLGSVMRRPGWWPVPRRALRLVIGELAEYALMSQRVVPLVAERHKYAFVHPLLRAALESLLRRP